MVRYVVSRLFFLSHVASSIAIHSYHTGEHAFKLKFVSFGNRPVLRQPISFPFSHLIRSIAASPYVLLFTFVRLLPRLFLPL